MKQLTEAEYEALISAQKFAGSILDEARTHLSDVDGGTIQDVAVACGLLRAVNATESCGSECRCVEYGEFPQECFRYTEIGMAAIRAMAKR